MSQDHNDATFDAFYQTSWGRLFGQAYVLTGNRELAQDLTQEALLRAWRQWGKVAVVLEKTFSDDEAASKAFLVLRVKQG